MNMNPVVQPLTFEGNVYWDPKLKPGDRVKVPQKSHPGLLAVFEWEGSHYIRKEDELNDTE